MIPVRVRVIGLPSAIHLAKSFPNMVLPPSIEDTLDDLVEYGIDVMSINILRTIRTDKSRGTLASSIIGRWEQTSGSRKTTGGTYELEVGSPLEHAKYVSRDIGKSTINRTVFIQPGRFRFIGIRDMIPKHPFLEMTLGDLYKVMPMLLGGHFTRYSAEVQRQVDELAGAEI